MMTQLADAVRELLPGVDVREDPDWPAIYAVKGDHWVALMLREWELADVTLAPWVARHFGEVLGREGQGA